jgi:quinol monooxygenase YgiN
MYARVSTFKVNPARLGEVAAKLEAMRPAAGALPGVIDVYAVWRADGLGTVMSIYKSQADADAAGAQIKELWASVADLLQGPPVTEAYDMVAHIAG